MTPLANVEYVALGGADHDTEPSLGMVAVVAPLSVPGPSSSRTILVALVNVIGCPFCRAPERRR